MADEFEAPDLDDGLTRATVHLRLALPAECAAATSVPDCAGAPLDARDSVGITPLDVAREHDLTEVAALLEDCRSG